MPEETKKRTRNKAEAPAPDKRPTLMPSGVTPDTYWSLGLEQYNPDAVVKANGLKIYREMIRRDPVIALGLQYLETARLAKGWEIVPGDGPRGEEIAEFSQFVLENIEGNLRGLFHDLMDALPMGFAVIEKIRTVYPDGPFAGKWGYLRFSAKWQESIDLKVGEFGDLEGIKYKGTIGNKYGELIEGEDLKRFIVFVPNRQKGNWYGESVLRPIYRVYTIKDHLTRYLAVHMEKFGSGAVVQQTDALSGDRDTILTNLKKMHGSMCYVIGSNETLTFNYPPGDVGAGLVAAIEHCNSEMLKALSIPQTMFSGTGESGQGGSLALSETHERTFGETEDRIGRHLEDCADENILRELADWNYPNVQDDEYAHFKFHAYQEEDGLARLERLEKAKDLGADLLVEEIYEAAGAERPTEETPEDDVIEGGKKEAPAVPFGNPIPNQPDKPEEQGALKFAEAVREVNEWERKVNFAEIEGKLNGIVAGYLDEAAKLAAEIRDTALEVVDEKIGKRE